MQTKIVTSWDDGGKDDLRIAKLVNKYGLEATFYVVVDNIGKEGYLSWEDIRALSETENMFIGSHTMTHPMDMKRLYDEELFFETQTSKDLLETALGRSITSFCYPRGRADDRVKNALITAGYLEARGTGKPGITTIDDNFYLPGTIHIFQRPEYGDKDIFTYAKEVIDRVVEEGGYCNIWGHSAEIEKNGLWEVTDKVLKYAGNAIKKAKDR